MQGNPRPFLWHRLQSTQRPLPRYCLQSIRGSLSRHRLQRAQRTTDKPVFTEYQSTSQFMYSRSVGFFFCALGKVPPAPSLLAPLKTPNYAKNYTPQRSALGFSKV